MEDEMIVISLGANCGPKLFFRSVGKTGETFPFDWVGSSMWAINELVQDGFARFMQDKNLVYLPVLDHHPPVLVDMNYYIRLIHENPRSDFKRAYQRRARRFLDAIKVFPKILFIRVEETQEGRIRYPAFTPPHEEEFYLRRFIQNVETLRGTERDFSVLYLNEAKGNFRDDRIVFLRYQPPADWKEAGDAIARVIRENHDLIFGFQAGPQWLLVPPVATPDP